MWGFLDQSFSSLTNLALSVVAGRLLGPSGLGTVFIGFSSYLWVLGIQRSLISDPLVINTASTLPTAIKKEAQGKALTLTITQGFVASSGLALVSLLLNNDFGRSLFAFAPWILPAMVQDLCRTILFQEGRGRAGTLNDGAWLLIMLISVPMAIADRSAFAVVSIWGIGALTSAIVGLFQVGVRPFGVSGAWSWWRNESLQMGKHLAAGSLVSNSASYLTVLLLVPILGTRLLGGLRAVQTVFAPLSLIGPAIAMPGLPALVSLGASSDRKATALAQKLGLLAAVVTISYTAALALRGGTILSLIFGLEFSIFSELIWPVGLWQVFLAGEVGVVLLMKAQKEASSLLIGWTTGSVALVTLTWWWSLGFGVNGAAWGLAGGAAVRLASMLLLARRHYSGNRLTA